MHDAQSFFVSLPGQDLSTLHASCLHLSNDTCGGQYVNMKRCPTAMDNPSGTGGHQKPMIQIVPQHHTVTMADPTRGSITGPPSGSFSATVTMNISPLSESILGNCKTVWHPTVSSYMMQRKQSQYIPSHLVNLCPESPDQAPGR